jgi:hypothetical protein
VPQSLKVFFAILLFGFQLFLSLEGVIYFGKYWNPVWLLLAHVALFILYLSALRTRQVTKNHRSAKGIRIAGTLLGILSILVCLPSLQALFQSIPNPVDYSDVIPQLDIQYQRFKAGILPYQPMDLPHSKPYPVYMPFHWLPAALTDWLRLDIRWSGIVLMFSATGLYGWWLFRNNTHLLLKTIALTFPAVALISFCYWGGSELAISLETTITAYYIILATGLFARSLPLTIFGLALCFLSRYTMIFWVPLFTLLLLHHKGLKPALTLVVAICLAVVVFYVLPFLTRDPEIFMKGLRYHNDAAAFEWGHGAWSFENGLYFAPHINDAVKGSWEHKVMVARVLQAACMLLLFAGGLFYQLRKKTQQNFYDFSLGMLYLFLVMFYMVGPLTYRYYLLTPLTLSGMLVGKMIYAMYGKKRSVSDEDDNFIHV